MLNSYDLKVKDGNLIIFSDKKPFVIKVVKSETSLTYTSDGLFLSLSYLDFNPILDEIYVKDGFEFNCLSYLFERFSSVVEEKSKKFKDFFVHSKKRNLAKEELLYACLNHIEIYKNTDSVLCLISLISYRVSEDLSNNSKYLDYIYSKYLEFVDKVCYFDPLEFRWFVSSSTPLSVCLIESDMFVEAEEILENVASKSFVSNIAPLTYWNIIVSFHLLALLAFKKNEIKKSAAIFLTSFSYSQNAFNVLHNSQNPWVFSQYYDFDAFQKLSKNALSSAYILYKGTFPVESKFSQPKVLEIPRSNVNVLLQRYPYILSSKKSNIRKIFYKINRFMRDE